MVRHRDDSLFELGKFQALLSQQIVQKDPDYGKYSGASEEIGEKIAKLTIAKKTKIFPRKFEVLIDFQLAYLEQRRKAYFAGVSSTELSKLGFIRGMSEESLKAGKLPWR